MIKMQKKISRHDKWTKKEFAFVPGTRMKKRALFIGINYENDTKHRLVNAISDATLAMETLIMKVNWVPLDYKILTDNTLIKPSRNAIIDELQWLTASSVEGDTLFIHISGHSVKLKTTTAFIPLDFTENKTAISSKVFYEILVKNLPAKVILYVIFDTCHSGSMLRLPFVYSPEINVFLRKSKLKIPEAIIVMLSSCHKEQKATDTESLSQWVYNKLAKSEITWKQMIQLIRQYRINQTPIITASRPLNLMENHAFKRLVSQRKLSWWQKLADLI